MKARETAPLAGGPLRVNINFGKFFTGVVDTGQKTRGQGT
jgi:hypothetical protein